MPATLPAFSRGLKLVRVGVFLMLLQLVLSIIVGIKSGMSNDQEGARDALQWLQYLLLAHGAATVIMLIGVAGGLTELARTRLDTRGLVTATAGFLIATAALAWAYHLFAAFVDIAFDPDASLEAIVERAHDLEGVKYVVIVKDVAYALGLMAVLRTVRESAAASDQLALRDEAASMGRAVLVMLIGDLFYQLTYGLGGSVGITGLIGSLLVGVYWIWCHVRLVRFLENAAYFMNEPHNLPTATALRMPADDTPTHRTPPPHPSQPVVQARAAVGPVVVPTYAPPPPRPAPRAEGPADGENAVDAPRLLG